MNDHPSKGAFLIRRVLFVSFACYLDDANGASVASRGMFESLARSGFSVEVLSGPILEQRNQLDLMSYLHARGLSVEVRGGDSWDVGAAGTRPLLPLHARLELHDVSIMLLLGSTLPRVPTDDEHVSFLQLFEEAYARHRPEIVVSYGGGLLTREVLRRAKAHGATTVFPLHNLKYFDRETFADVDAIVVASQFAAEHYRATLGLQCTVLPNVVDFQRVRAIDRVPSYVVFVNPTVEKGVAVFARIADELGRRYPSIPFLVVESVGTEEHVAACGLDLRVHGNVFFQEHTADPRLFWRVARVLLLPSLVAENQPLVAIEAMVNGVPVLGSNRGGIPETLGSAGTIIPIPDRLSPSTLALPSREETAAWVEAIVQLWDSPELYEQHSKNALAESARWAPEVLASRYEQFFAEIASSDKSSSVDF